MLVILIAVIIIVIGLYYVLDDSTTKGVKGFFTKEVTPRDLVVDSVTFTSQVRSSIEPAMLDTVPEEIDVAPLVLGKWKNLRMEGTPGSRRFVHDKRSAVFMQMKPPPGWAKGTSILPRMHFLPLFKEEGIVHMNLWYKCANLGDEYPEEFKKIGLYKEIPKNKTNVHMTMLFPEIQEQDATEMTHFLFILERYTNEEDSKDTYKGDMDVTMTEFEFLVRQIGKK